MSSHGIVRGTIALGMALVVGIAGAQQAPAGTEQEEVAPVKAKQNAAAGKAQQPAPVFRNRDDKLSYAIGFGLARDLKWGGGIDLNVDLLLRAMRDTFEGNELGMSLDEATTIVKQFEADRQHDIEHAQAMIGSKNKQAGETFFVENMKKEGVVTLPSGLQYKILKRGTGNKPKPDDIVVCNYRAALVDGTEFDSSYKRGQPKTSQVKALLPGVAQALQLMPVGSTWELYVPPQLAYGDRMVGRIGPNAMLKMEVELISIQDKARTQSSAPNELPAQSQDRSQAPGATADTPQASGVTLDTSQAQEKSQAAVGSR